MEHVYATKLIIVHNIYNMIMDPVKIMHGCKLKACFLMQYDIDSATCMLLSASNDLIVYINDVYACAWVKYACGHVYRDIGIVWGYIVVW